MVYERLYHYAQFFYDLEKFGRLGCILNIQVFGLSMTLHYSETVYFGHVGVLWFAARGRDDGFEVGAVACD